MSQLNGVAPVRIVQRLVGQKAVDLRIFDSRIVQTRFDRLEMERVGRRIRSFSDNRLAHADNAIFPARVRHMFLVPRAFTNGDRQLA
jgi:hypothetical protein